MKCRARVQVKVPSSLHWVLLFWMLLPLSSAFSDPVTNPVPCQLAQNTLFPSDPSGYNPVGLFPTPNTFPTSQDNMIVRPKQVVPIGCPRPFLYRGEIYSVDSPQAKDAETLKFFTKDSSQAQTLLNQYQDNRERTKISAYAGTAGLVLAVLALPLGRWVNPSNPATVQTAALLLGSAIAVEGISYSLMLLRENESLLARAVDAHNQDKPKDPVELQFSTGWSF